MSVFYRLHQDQSTGTKRSGKWYARAVPMAVVDTRKLAEIVQRNCTVKLSDVLAVIAELVETMRDQLQDSKRVKLDGFNKFSVAEHVKGLHVVFTPERSTDPSGTHTKQFLQGCRVEELPLNTVVKDEEPEP